MIASTFDKEKEKNRKGDDAGDQRPSDVKSMSHCHEYELRVTTSL